MHLVVALDVTGCLTNTSTKLQCGTLNQTNQEELQTVPTSRTFRRTISTQPTSCGLVNTRQTAAAMNGLDTADIGTMH